MGGKLTGAQPCSWVVGKRIVDRLKAYLRGEEVIPAGSYRRKCKELGDVDIIVVTEHWDDAEYLKELMARLGLDVSDKSAYLTGRGKPRKFVRFLASPGEAEHEFVWADGKREGVQIDLYFCPPESRGAFMLYLTGSQKFNIWQRNVAIRHGYKLTQWGLFGGEARTVPLDSSSEYAVCHALKMRVAEPEWRSDAQQSLWGDLLYDTD